MSQKKLPTWHDLARVGGLRFLAIGAGLWLLVETTCFFLKLEIAPSYRVTSYTIYLCAAAVFSIGSLLVDQQTRLKKAHESRLQQDSQIEQLNASLEIARKQDVTSALVAELEQAFAQQRWQEVIKIGSALSRPLWVTGRYQTRIKLGQLVEEAASYARSPADQASALIDDLGWTKVALGRPDDGEQHITHGLRLALEAGNAYLQSKAYRHLSGIAMKRGDYQEAQEQLVKAKEAMAGVTDARTQAELDANFAYVDGVLLQKKKDYPAALSSLELAQKKFHELNDRDRAVKCYGVIGDIYLAQKSLSAAKDSYRSGLSVAQQVSRKDAEMKCLDGLGKTALAEALPLEAKKFFEAAAKLATQLGDLDRASDLTRRAATLRG